MFDRMPHWHVTKNDRYFSVARQVLTSLDVDSGAAVRFCWNPISVHAYVFPWRHVFQYSSVPRRLRESTRESQLVQFWSILMPIPLIWVYLSWCQSHWSVSLWEVHWSQHTIALNDHSKHGASVISLLALLQCTMLASTYESKWGCSITLFFPLVFLAVYCCPFLGFRQAY